MSSHQLSSPDLCDLIELWLAERPYVTGLSVERHEEGSPTISYLGHSIAWIETDFVELMYVDGVERGYDTVYAANPDFFETLRYTLDSCIGYLNLGFLISKPSPN